MAFNGSGVFVRLYNWVADAALGTKIRADKMDAEMDGFATGLSNCVTRDGQTTTTTRIPFAVGVQLNTGTAAAPATNFSGDTDTGTYSPGADQWAVSCGGIARLTVTATGAAVAGVGTFGDGAVGAPAIAFTSDTDSGIYRIGANNIGLAVNGAKVLDIGTAGLGITGTLSATSDFSIATNKFNINSTNGNFTAAGAAGITGNLSVTGDVAVNTNKFNVTAASGNATIAGTLGVTGAATVGGTLGVTGVATLAAGSTMGGNAITNFPSGTIMLFNNTTAPTGWTKLLVVNDAALRLITGTVGSGGTANFSTAFAARTIAQANLPSFNLSLASLTITVNESPHFHGMTGTVNSTNTTGTSGNNFVVSNTSTGTTNFTSLASATTANATTGITASPAGTLPSGGSGTAMDFAVKFVDVIAATKT